MRSVSSILLLACAVWADDGFSVAGRVVDERGRAIAGATVEVRERRREPLLGQCETAGDGTFAVRVLGTAVRKREHPFGPVSVLVRARKRAARRLEASAGDCDLRIVLAAVRAISGTIHDLEGTPLGGVAIRAGSEETRTNPDGVFSLPTAGTDIDWISVFGGEATPTRVRVPLSGKVEARVVRMPYATFTGRVTRASDGAPVAGAKVVRSDLPPVVSDAEGRFTIRLLRKGVSQGGAGFASAEGFVEVIASGFAVEIVKVVDGIPLNCRLESVPPLQGRVLDEEGTPVPRAEISLRTSWLIPVGRSARLLVESDKEGRFRLDAYPREKFKLLVRARGFLETESEGLEVRLRRGATVTGRVVDEEGGPVVGAQLRTRYGWGAAYSDARGRFVLQPVPHAARNLWAARDERESVRTALTGVSENVGDLVLRRRLPLSGALVDDAQAPIAHVVMRCTGDGVDRAVETDDTGAFRFEDLPLGSYRVKAEPQRHSSVRASVVAGETIRLVAQRLEGDSILEVRFGVSAPARGRVRMCVKRGKLRRDVIVDLADGVVRLEGLVRGRYSVAIEAVGFELFKTQVDVAERGSLVAALVRGAPLEITTWPGAHIAVRTLRGREAPASVEADASGHATVYGVGSGSYLLIARKPGQLLAIRAVDVAEDRPKVELRAGEGARLAVKVIDEDGVPVRRARFLLITGNGHEIEIQGETDASGHAVLSELTEGDVQIRALEGDREGEVSITVVPGADLVATIRLSDDTVTEID